MEFVSVFYNVCPVTKHSVSKQVSL